MPTDTPRTVPLRPSDIPVRAKLLWDGALASGVLTPISTRLEVVEQAGVRFQVRVLEGPFPKAQAGRRQRARAQRGEEADPFGPCEPSLLLGDLGPSHCCVLNKFPALAHHLLIVTRAFEDQERLLTVADLEALWIALAGVDGFAFYNGGKVAGASQRHKHLQLVPLPMAQGEPPLPMEARIGQADFRGGVGRVAGLPFVHAIARLSDGLWSDPRRAAIASLGTYHRLLEAVGLPRRPGLRRQAGPYNLLVTRSWCRASASASASAGGAPPSTPWALRAACWRGTRRSSNGSARWGPCGCCVKSGRAWGAGSPAGRRILGWWSRPGRRGGPPGRTAVGIQGAEKAQVSAWADRCRRSGPRRTKEDQGVNQEPRGQVSTGAGSHSPARRGKVRSTRAKVVRVRMENSVTGGWLVTDQGASRPGIDHPNVEECQRHSPREAGGFEPGSGKPEPVSSHSQTSGSLSSQSLQSATQPTGWEQR